MMTTWTGTMKVSTSRLKSRLRPRKRIFAKAKPLIEQTRSWPTAAKTTTRMLFRM